MGQMNDVKHAEDLEIAPVGGRDSLDTRAGITGGEQGIKDESAPCRDAKCRHRPAPACGGDRASQAFRFRALPKRWIRVTIPVRGPSVAFRLARWARSVWMARVITARQPAKASGRLAKSMRSGQGKLRTHWRAGTYGMT